MSVIKHIGFLLLFGKALALQAQTCYDNIPVTTPTSAFTIHNDGTASHHKTGLMWMRCQLGRDWNGSTCSDSGESYVWQDVLQSADSYSWQSALQAADNIIYAGYDDWRLPNKNELASIVERSCVSPAINTTIFPNSYTGFTVLSSSPTVFYSNAIWTVDFDHGIVSTGINTGVINDFRFKVRLVRGGD